MDVSHVIVQDTFSYLDAYRLFGTQGLRHLPVVDDQFQVIGIITRRDLLHFHFETLSSSRALSVIEP
jgi:chloride channel 7